MANEAKLEWTMAVEGGVLRVRYRLTNLLDGPVWRVDALVVAGRGQSTHALAPGRLVVLNGDAPGDLSFTLGQRGADQPLLMVYPPHWQKLGPRESVEGEAMVSWPLRPWHNQGHADDFLAPPRSATLIVEVAASEPTWQNYETDDGASFPVGTSARAAFAVGDILPVPAP